jgi:very-short-patch-repair endonuclease
MDAVTALRQLGGTARAAALLGLCTRRSLQAAVAAGQVHRVARGRYALPGLPRASLAAAAAPGVLAGVSAAQAYGWSTLHRRDDAVVAVLPGQRISPRPAVTYRRRSLTARERREGRTGALLTVVDCATSLPFVDALAVADAALRERSLEPVALRDAALTFRGRGAADLRRVARHADGRAANAFESGLRGHLLLAGLRTFQPQHVITGDGFFAQVDLADPDRMVALEADGFETHGGRRQLAADLCRHDELAALGWVTLRFAWEHVMFRPEWVVHQVRSVLAGRRVRRPRAAGRRGGVSADRPRTVQRHQTGGGDANAA